MSIRWLPREMGVWILCNGRGATKCPAKHFTGNIRADSNRAYLAQQGWGRGLRKGKKRDDLCPTCMPIERELHAKEKAAWAAEKLRRAELKKAKLSAAPLPKATARKRKASAEVTNIGEPGMPSLSADSAPAPATP